MIFTKSTALENQKSDTPKLSLQYEQIATDTHTLRSFDWDRSRFDIEFGPVSYTHLTLPTICSV